MKFKTEHEMSICFKSILRENNIWNNFEIIEEFKGVIGVPDYLLISDNNNVLNYAISFELKLKNWKKALIQAFRHQNYVNQTFVVLDENYITPAIKNKELFVKSNTGLISINPEKKLKIYYYPKPAEACSLFFINKLNKKLSECSEYPQFLNFKNKTSIRSTFRRSKEIREHLKKWANLYIT